MKGEGAAVGAHCSAELSIHGRLDLMEVAMTLKSDTEALASIEEEAEAMLKKIGLPDDHLKKDMVICLRQIIAIARYRKGLGANPVIE
ncbi:hypothetical protein [Pseudomonas sp. JR33AA]|uniref:hypothetical protein n=1 Tax=Pseudomonas sp. JR33AA TaxID=2899113 RepID=UPI001F44E4F4|nr:hypothetical protein [Pseudomonas sp. JR33AA]MCE5976673.1 hypothetical protein [Pseudomonas sp. JR33AA]